MFNTVALGFQSLCQLPEVSPSQMLGAAVAWILYLGTLDLLLYVSLRNFLESHMRDTSEIRALGILGAMGTFKVGLYFRL